MPKETYEVSVKLLGGTQHSLSSGLELVQALEFCKAQVVLYGELLQIEKSRKVLDAGALIDDHITVTWRDPTKQYKGNGMFCIFYLTEERNDGKPTSPEKSLSLSKVRKGDGHVPTLWELTAG